MNLETDYDKILYIDLDLHHGDGVENAFIFSDKVFTFSMHKHTPGFFPGTGSAEDRGKGKGSGYCLNLPIGHKISGKGFYEVFKHVFPWIIESFDPDIIVCVCGADVLTADPHAAFDVGSESYANCIADIVKTQIPTVFLGGGIRKSYFESFIHLFVGGYNHTATAKLWSILTHEIITGSDEIPPLPQSVPEHEFWPLYALDEDLSVPENNDNYELEAKDIQLIKSYIDVGIYF